MSGLTTISAGIADLAGVLGLAGCIAGVTGSAMASLIRRRDEIEQERRYQAERLARTGGWCAPLTRSVGQDPRRDTAYEAALSAEGWDRLPDGTDWRHLETILGRETGQSRQGTVP